MNPAEFPYPYIEQIVQRFLALYDENLLPTSTGGRSSYVEELLATAARQVSDDCQYGWTVTHRLGSFNFPDIAITAKEGAFGVEAKSSFVSGDTDSWASFGNSIFSKPSVPPEYLWVVKVNLRTGEQPHVRTRPFYESITDFGMDHKVRSQLNLDLEPSESFLERHRLTPQDLCRPEIQRSIQADVLLKEGNFRPLSKIPQNERKHILAESYICFPEIVSSHSPSKYDNLSQWLARKHAVVDGCLRDKFSAGGKTDIDVAGKTFHQVPRIIATLASVQLLISQYLKASLYETLKGYESWNDYQPELDTYPERVRFWTHKVAPDVDSEIHVITALLFPEIE